MACSIAPIRGRVLAPHTHLGIRGHGQVHRPAHLLREDRLIDPVGGRSAKPPSARAAQDHDRAAFDVPAAHGHHAGVLTAVGGRVCL